MKYDFTYQEYLDALPSWQAEMHRKQDVRNKERLKNVTPISTPFIELITKDLTK